MPTLFINTNATSDNKIEVMKKLSKIVAEGLGKPESYVQIIWNDATMIFGGEEVPTAHLSLYSMGKIESESNSKMVQVLTKFFSDNLKVAPNQMYIAFTDLPPANIGWSGDTFEQLRKGK